MNVIVQKKQGLHNDQKLANIFWLSAWIGRRWGREIVNQRCPKNSLMVDIFRQGSSVVEQRTHKPLVEGSTPSPATGVVGNIRIVSNSSNVLWWAWRSGSAAVCGTVGRGFESRRSPNQTNFVQFIKHLP